MSKDCNQVQDLVGAAIETGYPIKISRRGARKLDKIEGFPLAGSRKWLLLQRIDCAYWALDGYVALRISDISRMKRLDAKDEFEIRVLRHFGEAEPRRLPKVDVTSTNSIVTTVGARFPLITLFVDEDETACFIGQPLHATGTTLKWLQIQPGARWDLKPKTLDLKTVTRIDFGTRYERALAALGGNPEAPTILETK